MFLQWQDCALEINLSSEVHVLQTLEILETQLHVLNVFCPSWIHDVLHFCILFWIFCCLKSALILHDTLWMFLRSETVLNYHQCSTSQTTLFQHSYLYRFNSLWPSDVIRRHGCDSALPQVKGFCLMASSYYLIQYWFFIKFVPWCSHRSPFIRGVYEIHNMCSENTLLKLAPCHQVANKLTLVMFRSVTI